MKQRYKNALRKLNDMCNHPCGHYRKIKKVDVPEVPLSICEEEHIEEMERWVDRIYNGSYSRICHIWSDHKESAWKLISCQHSKDTPMPEYPQLLSLITDLNTDLKSGKPLLFSRRRVISLKRAHGIKSRPKAKTK